jgi:predicted RNase H-like nuclease (RuvC/YqgF family)
LLNLEKQIVRASKKRFDWIIKLIKNFSDKNILVYFEDVKGGYGKRLYERIKEESENIGVYYIDESVPASAREYFKKKLEETEQEDEDKTAELQKQVEELTTENNDLKAKITELEAGKTEMSAEVAAAKKVALEMAEEMKKGIKPEEGKKKSYEEMSNKEKALYNRGKL